MAIGLKKKKTKLEEARSAARQQVGKLYIIAACVALLVCGGSSGHPKRKKHGESKK
ncbi:hypothetical protein ACP70R_034427 [Stipagrostis hirtigluma subsp. patula]